MLITPLVGNAYLQSQITYKYFTRQSDAYNFISGMFMYIRILTNLSIYYVHTCSCNTPHIHLHIWEMYTYSYRSHISTLSHVHLTLILHNAISGNSLFLPIFLYKYIDIINTPMISK